MTLSDLYDAARGGSSAALDVLRAQHWFCSLADFDPRSGEPLPRPLSRVLALLGSGAADLRGSPRDRLWRICNHCAGAMQALFLTLNEEPRRVHERLHVRDARELDVQSFVKLSMRPGLNIRQKLAVDPHLEAVRHAMSADLPENRLLKACAEALAGRLDQKAEAVGLSQGESELLERIRKWLHTDVAESISGWTNLPPNNTLLSHREYRRVLDAWRELDTLDERTAGDWNRRNEIRDGILFWNDFAARKSVGSVQIAEVPLLFDAEKLSVAPFDGHAIPLGGLNRLLRCGDRQALAELPKRTSPVQGVFEKCQTPVCVDLTSARPVFSADGQSAQRLPRILAWQRWTAAGNPGETVDTGCFGADGVWERPGVETVTPMDAFFPDATPGRNLVDTAFRAMAEYLRRECFGSGELVWLVPDFLDDFSLGLPRRAVNAAFSRAAPLPRSVAAVVAQVPYDSVNHGDTVLVVDEVGGVFFATKLEAVRDDALAEAVPETCGIRWTRHPSAILPWNQSVRKARREFPVVNESGEWSPAGKRRPEIPREILPAASTIFGRCSKMVFANHADILVRGGFRIHVLQQRAGDLSVWRDQLPALSMSGVIVDGMYGDFVLVNPSAESIRPVRGQAVSIPVPREFFLPRRRTVFPLKQGVGKEALDYVAEVDFPAQPTPTPCCLDLRYTYGADEPYSLDFIPLAPSRGLPRRIRAKWVPASQVRALPLQSCPSPEFPPEKSWQELREFPGRDGSGKFDLVSFAERELVPPEREEGIVKTDVKQKGETRYFFISTTRQDSLYCKASWLRHPEDIDGIFPGRRVWFALRHCMNPAGEEWDAVNDVSLDETLFQPLQWGALDLARQLRVIRFHMLTIMQGARSLASPAFPEELRIRLKNASDVLGEALDANALPNSLKSEALQFLSYLHAFAPPAFRKWAVSESRDSAFISRSWRKLAYCMGDVSQEWQQSVLKGLLVRISRPKGGPDVCLALNALSIAAWRSPRFLLALSDGDVNAILDGLDREMCNGPDILADGLAKLDEWAQKDGESNEDFDKRKKWHRHLRQENAALPMELLLALLRLRPDAQDRFAPSLRPGSKQSRRFVELVDKWIRFLHKKNLSLPFKIKVDAEKPSSLKHTPDFLYALRCCLTGDDGANAISTFIDEGDDTEDNGA